MKTGRTVEEAVEASLEELGVGQDDVEIEVLEEPNRGLFVLLVQTSESKGNQKISPEQLALIFLMLFWKK